MLPPRPRLFSVLILVAFVAASPASADEGAAPVGAGELESVEATVGPRGGLVRLRVGLEAGLLPGSARLDAGWHRLRLDAAEQQLPAPEGIGPREIDRRSSTPLGLVEGPAVPIGPGFRVKLLAPEPSDEVGTGMIDPADWQAWLDSPPEDLMPFLPPPRDAQRRGFLVRIPGAGPPDTDERVSVWLRSPGGLRRVSQDEPRAARGRGGEEELERWDPCLKLGRLDASGNAWFYLAELTCGLDGDPVWTPLREQSQREFAAWVIERTAPDLLPSTRKELKAMAKEEAKAERGP